MSIFEDKKDFMLLGGCSVDKINHEQVGIYKYLINEELEELMVALVDWCDDDINDQSEVIKEAIDLIYVTAGLLLSMGIDAQKAWNLVHENNLKKVGSNTVKDENGKIMKSTESIERKKEMMAGIVNLIESVKG